MYRPAPLRIIHATGDNQAPAPGSMSDDAPSSNSPAATTPWMSHERAGVVLHHDDDAEYGEREHGHRHFARREQPPAACSTPSAAHSSGAKLSRKSRSARGQHVGDHQQRDTGVRSGAGTGRASALTHRCAPCVPPRAGLSSSALGGGRAESTNNRGEQQRQKQRAGGGGHPPRVHVPMGHQQRADGLDGAGGDDEAGAPRWRPNTSEVRRPSMKPKTSPQIMPSGNPLKNMATTFHGAGITANSSNATPASRMSTMMAEGASGRVQLRDHLDADHFRHGISQHLGEHQCDLVVECKVPARHDRKTGRREGLAEGVHGKIRGKARQPRTTAVKMTGFARSSIRRSRSVTSYSRYPKMALVARHELSHGRMKPA